MYHFLTQHLDKLRNYNGVKEFVAALQSAPVFRLKKTKAGISSKNLKILDNLTRLTSSELNYKNLRSKLQSGESPTIPFPGVFQGDLVFLDESNKTRTEGGMINFFKLEKCTSLILELQTYQKSKYDLVSNLEIDSYVKLYVELDDDAAFNQSLICEPRV